MLLCETLKVYDPERTLLTDMLAWHKPSNTLGPVRKLMPLPKLTWLDEQAPELGHVATISWPDHDAETLNVGGGGAAGVVNVTVL